MTEKGAGAAASISAADDTAANLNVFFMIIHLVYSSFKFR
jgi:hypothetical protein